MAIVSWYSPNQLFDENEAQILNQFNGFLQTGDIKSVRYLLRTYNVFNKLDSRSLNFLFHIPGYKFTKRNGQLTLYKPLDRKTKLIIEEDDNESEELQPRSRVSNEVKSRISLLVDGKPTLLVN